MQPQPALKDMKLMPIMIIAAVLAMLLKHCWGDVSGGDGVSAAWCTGRGA